MNEVLLLIAIALVIAGVWWEAGRMTTTIGAFVREPFDLALGQPHQMQCLPHCNTENALLMV